MIPIQKLSLFLQHYIRPWTFLETSCFCLAFLAVSVVLYVLKKKRLIQTSQAMAVCVIMLFLGGVFGSTVFTRETEETVSYQLELFWSWKELFQTHNFKRLEENLLNVILFLPLGFLLPAARGRRLGLGWACFCGLMVSAAIEVCQLVLRRGLFEWDDMVHNSLGCIFGCALMNAVLIKLSDRRK